MARVDTSALPFNFDFEFSARKRMTWRGRQYQPGEALNIGPDRADPVLQSEIRKMYAARMITPDHEATKKSVHRRMRGTAESDLQVQLDAAVAEIADLKSQLTNALDRLEKADAGTPPAADEVAKQAAADAAKTDGGAVPEKPLENYPPGAYAEHEGFGKWFIMDADGNKLSGPHQKKIAVTLAKPKAK